MQMDAEFKKEQNGTLFVPGGQYWGVGWGGGPFGPPAENFGMTSTTFFFTLLPPQKFTGPLLRDFKYIIGILGSSPVDWHPF